MEDREKILFICVHNSARSQMAEAFTRKFAGDRFEVESAGLEPGEINPLVIKVMEEEGFDLSKKETQSVFDLYKAGKTYKYIITVCDRSVEDQCPVFPGIAERHNWPFPDPAAVEGSEEKKLEQVRYIRDMIKVKVMEFLDVVKEDE